MGDPQCTTNIPPPSHPLQHLFPVSIKSGWTTATIPQNSLNENRRYGNPNTSGSVSTSESSEITQKELSDPSLGVHKISSGTTHAICTLSDGATKAWEAIYHKGSYKPSGEIKGGFGFYLSGGSKDDDTWKNTLSSAAAVVFSYAVRFEEDFDFVKGGKLPGIFGGEGNKAYSCTGGRKDDRCSCFNLRMMWRKNGLGELYAYLPITASNTRQLLAIPGSYQDPDYGFSVGRGAFTFERGVWTTVSQVVRLNNEGEENGEIEVWINGKSVIKATGLVIRNTTQSLIQGLHFQTFFGGSTQDWASPKEQRAWFTTVSGGIIKV